MASPSEILFDNLKSGVYGSEYFDVYDLGSGKINPLINVIPCFDLVEGKVPDFFGPYACNIIAFTGPYCKGDGSDEEPFAWDDEDVDKCKDILRKAYPIYGKYELHFMFDGDAPGIADAEDNEIDAIAFTKGKVATLVGDLIEYGVFYWGEMGQGEMSQTVNQIITNFYRNTIVEG